MTKPRKRMGWAKPKTSSVCCTRTNRAGGDVDEGPFRPKQEGSKGTRKGVSTTPTNLEIPACGFRPLGVTTRNKTRVKGKTKGDPESARTPPQAGARSQSTTRRGPRPQKKPRALEQAPQEDGRKQGTQRGTARGPDSRISSVTDSVDKEPEKGWDRKKKIVAGSGGFSTKFCKRKTKKKGQRMRGGGCGAGHHGDHTSGWRKN